MNAFMMSQFSYCPLIWMCHNRSLNVRINRIHERALRIVYRNYDLPFESLLRKAETVTIHHRNLQLLATEMYKVVHDLSPAIVTEIFPKNCQNYNLRYKETFRARKINTVYSGSETISVLGPKIWELVPIDIKNSNSLAAFKSKIKMWEPVNCPCRLCKTYVANLGFI